MRGADAARSSARLSGQLLSHDAKLGSCGYECAGAAGSVVGTGSLLISARSANSRIKRRLLDPRAGLDPAGDIDREWPHDLDRAGDILGRETAGEDHRHPRMAPARQAPIEALTGSAGRVGTVRVEQMEIGAKRLRRLDVGAASHTQRLDHLGAGAASDLLAERGALVAVKLDHRELLVFDRGRDLVERRVDENAADLGRAAKLRADLERHGGIAASWARRPVVEPDRPGTERDRLLGVLDPGDAAELDLHRTTKVGRRSGSVRKAPGAVLLQLWRLIPAYREEVATLDGFTPMARTAPPSLPPFVSQPPLSRLRSPVAPPARHRPCAPHRRAAASARRCRPAVSSRPRGSRRSCRRPPRRRPRR